MIIEYNMSADYCADWTAIDAIREITQNAIDSGQEYKCTVDSSSVSIVTKDVVLPDEVFTLGISHKNSDQAIGKYGEGFKLALMVLAREGLSPVIYNGNDKIRGFFGPHEQLGTETFKLEIIKRTLNRPPAICFFCHHTGIDLGELKKRVTMFSDSPLGVPEKPCEVLMDRPGNIYVGGLFVCKQDNLIFGYNFRPDVVELNRDRNMTAGVGYVIADAIANYDILALDTIYNLSKQDAADVKDLWIYVQSNSKIAKHFRKQFALEHGEYCSVGYVGGHGGGAVVSKGTYKILKSTGVATAVDKESPDAVLEQFVKDNKRFLRRDVRVRFEKVINKAKGWRKAGVY